MTQIFRITHLENLPFILRHGLHCPNSENQDPNFVPIGFPSLIDYRKERVVPLDPGGTLADYIPFYFWYRSPMLYVIHKGNDPEVIQTPQESIVYLVSSLETLEACGCRIVFTDRHAKLDYATFYNKKSQVDSLHWDSIKSDQWGRRYGAEQKELKQAECLVHGYMPREAIIGIAVANEAALRFTEDALSAAQVEIPVKLKPNFYF